MKLLVFALCATLLASGSWARSFQDKEEFEEAVVHDLQEELHSISERAAKDVREPQDDREPQTDQQKAILQEFMSIRADEIQEKEMHHVDIVPLEPIWKFECWAKHTLQKTVEGCTVLFGSVYHSECSGGCPSSDKYWATLTTWNNKNKCYCCKAQKVSAGWALISCGGVWQIHYYPVVKSCHCVPC